MRAKHCVPAIFVLTSFVLAGCAADGGVGGANFTTASIPEKDKVNPACVALAAKIDTLKQEGTVGRVEQAATGKSKTVVVKRASLGKVAELNQVYAEYQAKCSTITPKAATAGAPATQQVAANAAGDATAVAAKAKAAAAATKK
ncbi:MAG: hypothetical protein RLZ98_1408 [Pseudomonadota bacterium]|jgi:hypothetical protein